MEGAQGFTDADEVIFSQGLESEVAALDGDDTVFVYDPHGETFVVGGRGADTLVLCSMRAYDAILIPGDFHAPDEASDTIVIQPAVFASGTPGFARIISIRSFIVGVDTLVLRLPPGMEISLETFPSYNRTEIVVGDTRLEIDHPRELVEGALDLFLSLDSPSLVIETQTLPPDLVVGVAMGRAMRRQDAHRRTNRQTAL